MGPRARCVGRAAGSVSMESGLEGRNNESPWVFILCWRKVSMESGLEGRNNSMNAIDLIDGYMSQWSPA